MSATLRMMNQTVTLALPTAFEFENLPLPV